MSAATPRVSVVIPNWNGARFLGPCLEALARQTVPHTVVLVDNASTDGSRELVSTRFPHVRLIANRTNRGFAAAVNQGLAASDSEFAATLNNDTRAEPGWLAALVIALESDPRAGMCASRLLFADPPGVVNSAGVALDVLGVAWDRLGGAPTGGADALPVEVFGACAGAALYRRTMLADVGLLDERYFAYLEDVDLAWRARLRGWRALYAPDAVVIHHHSGTLGEGSPAKRRLLGRNKVRLVLKNYPGGALLRWGALVAVYDLAGALYSVAAYRDLASVRGRLEALGGLGELWQARRRVQARRTVGWTELRRVIEPPALPWAVLGRFGHLRGRRREGGTTHHE